MMRSLITWIVICCLFSCGKEEEKDIISDSDTIVRDDLAYTLDADCADLSSQLEHENIRLMLVNSHIAKFGHVLFDEIEKMGVQVSLIEDSYININDVAEVVEYSFDYKGVPLCLNDAKIYFANNKFTMLGNVPDHFSPPEDKELIWDQEKIDKLLFETTSFEGKDLDFRSISKCVVPNEDRYEFAWQVEFDDGHDPYYMVLDSERVYYVEARSFHLNALLHYAGKDRSDPSQIITKEVEINGLSKGGYLCNERFRVVETDDDTLAKSINNIFLFDVGDVRFSQSSVLANAMIQSNWFLELIPNIPWKGPQIRLLFDQINNGVNNTAVYIPGSSAAKARIIFGKGDNVSLQNIRRDADAIQHEVNHHVIYNSIKVTSGESLVLHEGLADFFVMARTGDACLGESLCPEGGTLCELSTCLRTADNEYLYKDPNTPSQPHLYSQLISGLLWDFAKKENLSLRKVAELAYGAIALLPRGAQIYHLLKAIVDYDQAVYQGEYCTEFIETSNNRGFQLLLEEHQISC